MKPPSNTADHVFDSILRGPPWVDSLLVGADIDRCNTAGWHLHHAATIVGDVGLLTSLLDRGADIHATCLLDDTYLSDPATQRVFNGYNFMSRCEWSCLQIACMMGHASIVSVLLARGADVNMSGEDGNTPLHCAARFGDVAVVELLIANGAVVNARTDDGATPLHLATRNRRLFPVVRTETGEGDDNGEDRCHVTVVEALIANGADLDAQDEHGWTAFLVACFHGYNYTVQLLIDNGADVNSQIAALSPLGLAVVLSNMPLLRVLAAHGATVAQAINTRDLDVRQ